MRIISGLFKGKYITTSKDLDLRPTTDFAKEGLFNILSHRYDFEQMSVLDLFSGTGSISYEFASRGCKLVHAVELKHNHAAFIRRTAAQLKFNQIRVIQSDVLHFLKICKVQYDLVFADPPYDMNGMDNLPELILKYNILLPGGIFIFEHSKKINYTGNPLLKEHRQYGNVNFSFFGQPEA